MGGTKQNILGDCLHNLHHLFQLLEQFSQGRARLKVQGGPWATNETQYSSLK